MTRDPRVDAYIADKTAVFARPILSEIREAVHAAGDIDEAIKWSAPAFLHRGKTLAIMAAFKRHAALNFMRGKELDFAAAGLARDDDQAMGQLGKLTSADDLPPADTLTALVRQAKALEDAGPAAGAKKKPIEVPSLPVRLAEALDADPKAKRVFEAFPPGARRDYIVWITAAKREATRAKRIVQAVEWIAEGKKRNWKYENC